MTATIEAHGLTKQYGKTKALEGLDLIAQRGQVTAVLGPNGAGKTTFVRMVATLLRADAGTLLVAGHDAHQNPAAVRRVIGLAGQFAAVEPAMTGRENLEMVARLFGLSRRAAKASAAAVLEQLSLVDAGDRLARTLFRGDAPQARPRREPGRRSTAAAARRAHHGPGSAEPDRAVGRDPGACAVRDRRAADHPVPR